MLLLNEKQYFIASIGTDAGKTFLVENLCHIALQKQQEILAIKPVISGFIKDDKNSDSSKILQALGLENSLENLESISPWRFSEPISPNFAAKLEKREVNFAKLTNFCTKKINIAKKNDKFLLIESAGGIMTPISDKKTFLDLAIELKLPILLVSNNYLSSISHSLCTIKAIKSHNLTIKNIIVNQNAKINKDNPSLLEQEQVIKIIESFANIETLSMEKFLLDCKQGQ